MAGTVGDLTSQELHKCIVIQRIVVIRAMTVCVIARCLLPAVPVASARVWLRRLLRRAHVLLLWILIRQAPRNFVITWKRRNCRARLSGCVMSVISMRYVQAYRQRSRRTATLPSWSIMPLMINVTTRVPLPNNNG